MYQVIAARSPVIIQPSIRRHHQSSMQVILSFPDHTTHARLATSKTGPVQLGMTRGPECPACLYHPEDEVKDTLQGSLQCSPHLTIEGLNSHKTITAVKAPAPAPALILSLSSAVPPAALDVPMPDLHAMAMVIRDGAAHIAILNGRMAEQDGKIDTLQCLHESLHREIVDWPPANATSSLLLDQSIPVSMSTPESTLPPLIDFAMEGMAPTHPTVKDTLATEGLLFEYSEVHPEGPNMSGEIVDPGDLGNLVPEYNSDDMNVEVKVEEDDMAI
ncbi:hypothetical protein EDB19DRAFT_1834190 [Suillus lakei]|nr:hypothetical protein EDB19DRAFT_1834190 [Suillus lakei]